LKNWFLLVCLLTGFLTGCWGKREINDLAFVTAIAIDRVDGQYEFSVFIPVPSRLGRPSEKSGTGAGLPYIIQTERNKNLLEAIEELQNHNSRQL